MDDFKSTPPKDIGNWLQAFLALAFIVGALITSILAKFRYQKGDIGILLLITFIFSVQIAFTLDYLDDGSDMNRLNQFFKPFVIELSIAIQFYYLSQLYKVRHQIDSAEPTHRELNLQKVWLSCVAVLLLSLTLVIAITTTYLST